MNKFQQEIDRSCKDGHNESFLKDDLKTALKNKIQAYTDCKRAESEVEDCRAEIDHWGNEVERLRAALYNA